MSAPRFSPPAAVTERTRRLRKIWRAMTPDERVLAIRAAAGPDRGAGFTQALRGHLAQVLKVRAATAQSWGVSQIAEATLRAPLSEDIIVDLLMAFHLKERVPLLSAFLDAAGIPHTEGVTEPDADVNLDAARLNAAADAVMANFPAHECQVYFATLIALEGGAWASLEPRLDESLRP
jgi:hypothetical protein